MRGLQLLLAGVAYPLFVFGELDVYHGRGTSGDKSLFECIVESSTDVTTTWLKDNRPLDDKLADRVIARESGKTRRLSIMNCRLSDAGLYTARITNDAGFAFCSAQLIVQELTEEERNKLAETNHPVFVVKLKDTELIEQSSARVIIKVKGDPNPTVEFKKDGKPLALNERVQIIDEQAANGFYEMLINKVTVEDSGKYSCIASNRFGEAVCEAEITVTDQSAISALLRSLPTGESTDFMWYKGGQPFEPDERFHVLFKDEEDSLALVFQHVKPEDAGIYTCIASTSSGKISCSAALTVEGGVYQTADPKEPEFTMQLIDSEVSVGGSAMLELKLAGHPKPKVQWFRGEEEVKAGGRFRFLYEDDESIALIIKGVTTEDAGLYSVIATNELGEAKTEGNLYVKAPPKFRKKMSDMSCMTDKQLKIDIEVEGSPAPEIKWYKDGKQISSTERIRFVQEKSETYTLVIEEVTIEDSGSYSVVASNAMGQMSEFFAIDAQAPPKFLKRMKELFEEELGQDVTLEVQVQANPKPEISWFQGDTEIKHDGARYIVSEKEDVYTMTIKNLTRRDSGKFKCKITNQHGADESLADVKVKAAPEVTKKMESLQAKEGDKNVAFEVSASAYPKPCVRWFIGEMEITEERTEFKKVEEDGVYKLVIDEVKAHMAGTYTFKIENEKGAGETSATLAVKTPPRITGQLTDTAVNEGTTCTLKVTASGVPDPSVKWLKDGSEISADANVKITKETTEIYSLSFTLVTQKDSGNYECVLTNEMGEVRTACTLTVQYKPRILGDNFKSVDAWEEEEVVLEVQVEGVPKPKAKWSKDGVGVSDSDRYVLFEEETYYRLKIVRAELSDTGDYSVSVENEVGQEVRSEVITIKSLAERRIPKVLKPFEDKVVVKGDQLVLEAKICGDPRPSVAWFKNGNPATESENVVVSDDGENIYNLVVNSIKQSDAGKYTVHASNEHGEDKYVGTVTVHSKPNIVGLNANKVEFGELAAFQAVVSANPKPKVEWLKDGQPLKKEAWIEVTNDANTYKLDVKECKVADAGVYTLKATNEIAEVTADAKLTVVYSEPSFKTPLASTSTKEGLDVQFNVQVEGIPKPTLEWYFGESKIENGEKYSIQEEGKLNISKVKEADFGKYIVKATNAIGSNESEAVLQLVQEPPSIGKGLEPFTNAKEGEVLTFSVKLDGSPIPTFKWVKDNVEIVPDDRMEISTAPDGTVHLKISDAKPEDSGSYRLVATNPNGEISSESVAAVQPKPRKPSFSKKLKNQTVSEGKPMKLEARLAAFPKPEVKWQKDGRTLYGDRYAMIEKPDGTVALEIDKVTAEDAGKYTLIVTNDLGEAKGSAEVVVEAAPTAPVVTLPLSPLKVVSGYPARLEAKVTGFPVPALTWTRNGEPVAADGSRVKAADKPDADNFARLVFETADADDSGDYTLTAANVEGKAVTSAPLEVLGGLREGSEAAPSFVTPLKDQYVEEGSGLRLACSVAGNPIPATSWLKDDQPLAADKGVVSYDGEKMILEIPKLSVGDAGRYEAVLTNPLGKSSSSANVQVRKIYQAPDFTQRFSTVQQLPTFDARFICKASGVPRPEITWYRGNQPLTDSEKYRIKRDGDLVVLFVCDVTPDDAGPYSCVAKNVDGEAKCEGALDVVDKIEKQDKAEAPAFMKRIGDCEVYEGMTAKFTACATGFPEPEFEFYRNGTRIYPSDRIKIVRETNGLIRLTIKHVDESDVGRYKLRVVNPHGEASCEADLCYDTLESRPKRPLTDQYADFDRLRKTGVPLPLADRPIISGMTDRYLTLSWKPSIPIGPRDPVTYCVEMSECPDGEWFMVRNRILGNVCDMRNLDPHRDYRFRIRVENKYGMSDPSPYAITYRENLHAVPTKRPAPIKVGEIPNFEHVPPEGMKYPPTFLRQEQEACYAVRHQSTSIHWFVYGYPKPEIRFTYDGIPITMGGKFESTYLRDGEATLFVSRMLEKDVGTYECVATNEHGEARQRIKLELAEHPRFVDRPADVLFMVRKPGRVVVKISGIPAPEVKWYKDWQPLAPSSRLKLQAYDSDTFILSITDCIQKDEGLYSIVARNVAGAVQASFHIRVEENEEDYHWWSYNKLRTVKPSDKNWEDFYDIGDEIGRGTQSVIKHVVERLNGVSYAAKIMHGNGPTVRPKMLSELEIMNQFNHRRLVRLITAYETKKTVTLIAELCGGGVLLDSLTRQTHLTESEVASYIRQVLQGLEHMHSRGYAHLGLTPGDILISRAGGDEIKLCDFSLSRRVGHGKLASMDYGMPEFVAPEIVNGEGVGTPADMWAIGVITYLFLSGISPFRGDTDRDTLLNVQKGQMNFDLDSFSAISSDAKDFIAKLMVFQAAGRLNVRDALDHPWLKFADRDTKDAQTIPTDRLKTYYTKLREWYSNSSCRTWFRRRPLSGAFIEPSRMVYPPGSSDTPRGTPSRDVREKEVVKVEVNGYDRPGYQVEVASSESHYQMGPDTFLLPLRDSGFPARLRSYMKVASARSPTFNLLLNEHNFDKSLPIIRERRRFTDIMDEEIDDEKKKKFSRYTTDHSYTTTTRRLRNEIGTRSECANQAEAILESKRGGKAPFFREKPKTMAIVEDKPIELSCLVVGDPQPRVQWYKNEAMLLPGSRISITDDEKGRSVLRFNSAMAQDVGIYKAVARNDSGQVTARARLVIGDLPSQPDSPAVSEYSDTEALIKWKVPKDDGNSPIACYSLQYRGTDETEWREVANNIDHEFFLVHGLKPLSNYIFRISARNAFGWSEKSIPSEAITTRETGAPQVSVTRAMKYLQQLTESGKAIEIDTGKTLNIDYSAESNPVKLQNKLPTEDYSFIAEIARGRFSLIAKCVHKTSDTIHSAKAISRADEGVAKIELDNLSSLRHERIGGLLETYAMPTYYVLILEKLQGIDVLTYLANLHDYTEQMVATVVSQVLDGLQYLHWRGLGYLDLQFDNIVLTSARTIDVKLVDFGSAEPVSKLGTKVQPKGLLDYTAPELLADEPAYPQSDIWSLGAITYTLLSGVSPFRGETDVETRQNIIFVRYRFEPLHKELTMEATRFLMLLFKRAPLKRPSVEECLENRWLQPTEFMIKKRQRAVFLGNRLKDFSQEYHALRSQKAMKDENIFLSLGMGFARSPSMQHDSYTTF